MRCFQPVGEDRRFADASGRKRAGELRVVENNSHHERDGLNGPWRDCRSGGLDLSGGDGLQHALDLAAVNLAWHELERGFDSLFRSDVARLVLRDLNADDRIRGVDEGHDGG